MLANLILDILPLYEFYFKASRFPPINALFDPKYDPISKL